MPKSYILKNTISKSDNNKRILAPNDNNTQHFLCSNLMSWPGLCESDNIKRMITLTVITLSGVYCSYKPLRNRPRLRQESEWSIIQMGFEYLTKMSRFQMVITT